MARLVALAALGFVLLAQTAEGRNPFTSDVVALNSGNWKEVLESPQGWFINFCREG
jgi:hypothetical protein